MDPFILDRTDAATWKAAVARVLKGSDPAETLIARSRDGIALGPLALKAEPGSPRAWRDAGKPVAVVQRIDHPDAADANRMALADAGNGAGGLTLVFAGAGTARGFGLATDAADALRRVLENIDLDAVTLRCEVPAFGGEKLLGRVLGAVESHGCTPEHPAMDLGIDPLSDMARTGVVPNGAEGVAAGGGLRLSPWMSALLERRPASALLRADGRPHHEAGASEAQELAAVLSAGVSYLRALEAAGADKRAAIAFTLAADADQMLTIAKFRALRRLWARVEQACGLPPRPIRLHGETAWRMLTHQDPWSNLVRNAIACAGAILGGADSVTVLPFTSALGLADPHARRLARNTPLVLLKESFLGRVADPCLGSGAFDGLTDGLCRAAWRLFQGLEASGGLGAALVSGTWQAGIAATRGARRADLADGKARIVGVTAFAHQSDQPPAVLRATPALAPAPPASTTRFPALPSTRDAEGFEADADGRQPFSSEGPS